MWRNCRKLQKITLFSNFLQISDILAYLMVPILLERAKNTFSVPNYMGKVSFHFILLLKFAKITKNNLKLLLYEACVANFMKYITLLQVIWDTECIFGHFELNGEH